MPVLDASFVIDLERGGAAALGALKTLKGESLELPWHAAVEVLVGREDPVATLAALRSSYEIGFPDEAHLLEGARLRKAALEQGRRAHWGDIYIATTALLSGTYVLTANAKDFEALGCRVWDYRKGGKPPA